MAIKPWREWREPLEGPRFIRYRRLSNGSSVWRDIELIVLSQASSLSTNAASEANGATALQAESRASKILQLLAALQPTGLNSASYYCVQRPLSPLVTLTTQSGTGPFGREGGSLRTSSCSATANSHRARPHNGNDRHRRFWNVRCTKSPPGRTIPGHHHTADGVSDVRI